MLSFLFALFVFLILIKVLSNFGDSFEEKPTNAIDELQKAKFFFTLFARLAKSDGYVSKKEAELVSVFLDEFSQHIKYQNAREILKRVFNEEKNKKFPRERDIASSYYKKFKPSIVETQKILNLFLNLVFIDGNFSSKEEEMLREISIGLNIPFYIQDQIFTKFKYEFETNYRQNERKNSYENENFYERKTSQKTPYEILGVNQNASFDEIKSVYRKLVKKYHPDILMGQGMDEKIIKNSTIKLQEINLAYDELRQKFQK